MKDNGLENLRCSTTKHSLAILGLFAFLCVTVLLSLFTGEIKIPLVDLFRGHLSEKYAIILFDIRLPRTLLVIAAGMSLSVSGTAFQCIFRNPLVSPYILGVASGAALGAAIGFALGLNYWSVTVLAFFFALAAVAIACFIAKLSPHLSTVTLLLAGVITASFFSALTSFVEFMVSREKLAAIVFWAMGGFSFASYEKVCYTLVPSIAGGALLYLLSFRLNVISLGDEEALALGLDVKKMRFLTICVATFVTSSIIAFTGVISWVGLIIPHIARMCFGADHRELIPSSMLLGAGFLLLADTISRKLISGVEVPISIVTSLVGVPFFVWLLMKKQTGWD